MNVAFLAPGVGVGRVVGVDAARGLALFGMVLAHLNATVGADGRATLIGTLVAGRASALFAVLAGIGVALSTSWVRTARDHAAAGAGLLVRAVVVGTLGLALVQVFGDPPAVILAQYALLFVVAVPLLRVGPGPLLAAAAAWCVVSPVLSHALRQGRPDGPGDQPDLVMIATPVDLLATLGLTGYYPVLTWVTYLLVGLGVGRLDLRAAATPLRLVAAGLLLAVVATAVSWLLLGPAGAGPPGRSETELSVQRAGTTPADDWRWLLVDARHSGTPLDLAHTVGSALVVIGGCLLLAVLARRVTALLAGAGALPLTLYTAHIVVAATWGPFGLRAWLAQVVVALAAGTLLRVWGVRGPFETVAGAAARRARRWARPPPAPAPAER